MTKQSVTGRIVCISNGTTYTPILQCNQGDLNQFYDDAGTPFPTFGGSNTPKLYFFVNSSEDSGKNVEITDDNMTWMVNGVTLTFSGGVSTNNFNGETGHFVKETTVLDGDTVQTLKVVKNLINVNNKSSFNIKAIGTISVENTSATPTAIFPVTIAKGEVGSRKVRIQSPDNFKGKPFTISAKQVYNEQNTKWENVTGSFCQLEAVVITTSSNSTSSFGYKWYKQVDGAWVDTALTSKVITVSEPDVDGSALYKVVVMDGDSEYGSDVQNVNDISDPYVVYPNCVDSLSEGAKPALEISYKNSGTPIIYAPYVMVRGSATKISASQVKYRMTLLNSVGVILNNEENSKTYNPPFKNTDDKDNFTIPEKFISDNNGIDWLIEANINN